jgi:hypothetical protein
MYMLVVCKAGPDVIFSLLKRTQFRRVHIVNGPLWLVQGLGEGPGGILAACRDGTICMLDSLNTPDPFDKTLDDSRFVGRHMGHYPNTGAVHCMAASDEILVTGLNNGALRVYRMDVLR